MKFPTKFNGHDTTKLKVKFIDLDESVGLTLEVFDSLETFLRAVDVTLTTGPFADQLNGELCIRFESKKASAVLSA